MARWREAMFYWIVVEKELGWERGRKGGREGGRMR